MTRFLEAMEALRARATRARPSKLGAAEARSLMGEVFGPHFPKERATGASVSKDGRFAVAFDGEFTWTPQSGQKLIFAANGPGGEVGGRLYVEGSRRGVRISHGIEAALLSIDIEEIWIDARKDVWAKPSVGPALKLW